MTAWRFAPLAVTVLVFVLLFLRVPFRRFADALAAAPLAPFAALMASFSVVYFLVDTFVLSRLLRWFHVPVAYRELLPLRASTYLVSLVNTQLGQGAVALYVQRRFGTPLAEIASTIGLLALLEVTQLAGFAAAGMIAFASDVPGGLLLAPLVVVAFWLVLFGVARSGGATLATVREHPLFRTFRRVTAARCLAILALKASVFALSIVVHRAALGLFGIDIPLARLFAFLPIVFLVAALPVTVAHLGTSQAAWVFFFHPYAPEADLLAYSLASHLTFMLANAALGVLFLPRAYADLSGSAAPPG
jgi:hypothetical protein